MSDKSMEEADEKQKGFKVEDRRRFSSEGELKPEFQNKPDEPPAPEQPTKPAPEAPRAAVSAESAPEINFTAFIVGLSTQALFHLGEMADPASNERQTDLPGAQQIIDILGMLREKTRGNLDRDEAGLLDSILYDLRMKYVEIARQRGQ